MNNNVKILVCVILVIALIGIAYAGSSASQTSPGQLKKPPRTTIPTTLPTSLPTSLPTTIPITPTPTPTQPPVYPTLIPSAKNPYAISNINEFQILQDPKDSSEIDMWFSTTEAGASLRHVGYAYATNALADNWIKTTSDVGLNRHIGEPYVIWDETTQKYYLIGIDGWRDEPGNPGEGNGYIYMWSSTDKLTWTPMNNGNPVMIPSNDETAVNYRFWNTAIQPVTYEGKEYLPMFFDCGNHSESLPTGSYHVCFSYSDLTELNWTAHVMPTTAFWGSTMDFKYIPERNAYLILLPRWNRTTNTYETRVSFADATNPLAPTNFKENPKVFIQGVPAIGGDPTFIVATEKAYPMIIMETHDQGSGSREFYINSSLLEFYDAYYEGAVAV